MTLDQFITKYNGKYVDFDHAWGYTCVDLMRFDCEEVLGIPGWTLPATKYAKQIFQNFPDKGTAKFSKIYNTPWNMPQKGDIIFFKTSVWFPFLYGIAGHVAIVSGANQMNLISFDQNYGKPNFSRFVNHNYKDCIGWIHPKV